MKRTYTCLALLAAALPAVCALSACGKHEDYDAHISERRSDIFRAETEEFTLTLSCVSREYPYAADGIACPLSNVVEISLVPAAVTAEDYTVHVLEMGEWGGEMSFRNYAGDWFYSQSAERFPEGQVSLRVEWGDNVREISATTVKNDKTLSVSEALACAVKAENKLISRLCEGGSFRGEFRVRLLRRDKNYYYVGIVSEKENLSLLLDGETGEVLARREN